MKSLSKLIIFIFTLLALPASVYAASVAAQKNGGTAAIEAPPPQAAEVNSQDTNELFQKVVAKYRAANPKPRLPEEARKFKVQAEFAVQKKLFDQAVEL